MHRGLVPSCLRIRRYVAATMNLIATGCYTMRPVVRQPCKYAPFRVVAAATPPTIAPRSVATHPLRGVCATPVNAPRTESDGIASDDQPCTDGAPLHHSHSESQ
jgi:hypothetical protein